MNIEGHGFTSRQTENIFLKTDQLANTIETIRLVEAVVVTFDRFPEILLRILLSLNAPKRPRLGIQSYKNKTAELRSGAMQLYRNK